MFRSILGLTLVTVLAFVGNVRAELPELTFEKVVSTEGRFVISMPGDPQIQTEVMDTKAGKIDYHQFLVPIGNEHLFMVGYFEMPEEIVTGRDPQELLKAFRSGARGNAEFLNDHPVSVGEAATPGLDYQVAAGEYYVRERMLAKGTRFYRLIVVGSKDNVLSSSTDQFLDSFRLIK